MVFATLSQKRYLNNQNKEHGFSKTPKLRVVDENLANYRVCLTWSKKPAKNKRHTPRGGRRTCYLVVVVGRNKIHEHYCDSNAPPVHSYYTANPYSTSVSRPQHLGVSFQVAQAVFFGGFLFLLVRFRAG